MYLEKIFINNFRLLKESKLDLDSKTGKEITLLIGRNNSGKTSFIVLFDKFLRSKNFVYDDFSMCLRESILNFDAHTNEHDLSIKLILQIKYSKEDSLENLSEFITDLDPEKDSVNVLFECIANKKKLVNALVSIKKRRKEFIKKNFSRFLEYNVFVIEDYSFADPLNRDKLIKKDWKSVDSLINFQVIHAKRNVASSESGDRDKRVLSSLTTQYYNSENEISFDELSEINASFIDMDSTLDEKYENYFSSFLKSAQEFLNMDDLHVISDLQSKEILSNHSKIVYGKDKNYLPEYLNGLGYMNILYLLLNIEIKKNNFINNKRDLNLFFIEEPEAHTHPQMQYVFIEKIKKSLEDLEGLQTLISTHSAHIVKRCNFEDIRYFLLNSDKINIEIKNFYSDLLDKYSSEDPELDKAEKAHFKFLNQYLTIASSELFFAEKIILIEGTTEKLLLPYFIKVFDLQNKDNSDYKNLTSQNISILEVGANAKAFRHFLEFLGIKTLIITDLDTTIKKITDKGKITYPNSIVSKATHTSNYTIKYYLNAPDVENKKEFELWFNKLKMNKLDQKESPVKVAYQIEENDYQGRSFEDAFISVNIEKLKESREKIGGLKNKDQFDDFTDFYSLTEKVMKQNGKSEFASSLLFLALSDDQIDWNIPLYIKEGLKWISK